MAITKADDELFKRAISGYREHFLVQHSHLSDSEKYQLWSQELSQFLPTPTSRRGSGTSACGTPGITDNLGKRTRQDVPRIASGSSPAKRQATTPEFNSAADVKRESSLDSPPAAIQMTRRLSTESGIGNHLLSTCSASSPRPVTMARSQSQQIPASRRKQSPAASILERRPTGFQQQLRLHIVDEYSPSEYSQQCLDFQGQSQESDAFGLSSDKESTFLQQQSQSPHRPAQLRHSEHIAQACASTSDLLTVAASAAPEMSRSATADSIIGGLGMVRFDSTESNFDVHFPSPEYVPQSPPQNIPPHSSCHFRSGRNINHLQTPLSESAPASFAFSTSTTNLLSRPPFASASSLLPSSSLEMKPTLSVGSDSSSLSQQSRAARRTQEQIVQGTRPIAPKLTSSPSKSTEQHKMTRITSEDGTSKEVAAIPKAPFQRPPRLKKTYCSYCTDQPGGFHGDHELRRHVERVHSSVRKVWVCVDISPDKSFLANCKACRNGKRYGANYNAAAHLRRTHFNPCQRGRGGRNKDSEKRGGKGGGNHPSMETLKHWMEQKEEVVLGNAQHLMDEELVGESSTTTLSPPSPTAVDGLATPEISPSTTEYDTPTLGAWDKLPVVYDPYDRPVMSSCSSFDPAFYQTFADPYLL